MKLWLIFFKEKSSLERNYKKSGFRREDGNYVLKDRVLQLCNINVYIFIRYFPIKYITISIGCILIFIRFVILANFTHH